jgi:hypothetical protein
MGQRLPNPRLAKIHRSYSVEDVSRLPQEHGPQLAEAGAKAD